MILQKFIDTYFFFSTNTPHHSIETAIVSLVITIVSFALFIFWNKKRALLNFQAWALLTTVINVIFFVHYFPFGPHVLIDGFEYQFTPLVMVLLMFLQYLTSVITIWRLWKLSEKYIPKEIFTTKTQPEIITSLHKRKRKIMGRFLALWHTVKYGGNNVKNDKKIKKTIKIAVLNI
jgi:hypothetical protein